MELQKALKQGRCPNCGNKSLQIDKIRKIERCPICHYYLDPKSAIKNLEGGIKKLRPEILGKENHLPKDWRSRVLK